MKSSDSSLGVALALQAIRSTPASSSEHSGEQLPGSGIVISIIQSGSVPSVIVMITSPPPALPPCKLKLVGEP